MHIAELSTDDELRSAYPIMAELRPHLSPERYMELTAEMIARGYRLAALSDQGTMVSVAGFEMGTNLYYGRYLWVYDLVTTAGARSHGYGARLLAHLEHIAATNGCDTIALSSGLRRTDAHRFYEDRMHYERTSFVFKKTPSPA